MSKQTTYLLGILLTLVIGTLLYCYLCDNCHCYPEDIKEPETNVPVPDAKVATMHPLAIADSNGDLSLNINDNFNFNESGFNYLEPVSADVAGGVLQIKNYIDANLLKRLNITGYYTSVETNNSAFPNLGLARANAVKNYFVSKGVASSAINTSGEIKEAMVSDDSKIYHGPVSFDIATTEAEDTSDTDELKVLGEEIKVNPLVLYFDSGGASINLTTEQRQKVADISRYLDKVEGATCIVVGHTDNTGVAANNLVLGQSRADFAKSYLAENAIPDNKIIATSKGQTDPIADNATEEGKSKNRRTVVTIN